MRVHHLLRLPLLLTSLVVAVVAQRASAQPRNVLGATVCPQAPPNGTIDFSRELNTIDPNGLPRFNELSGTALSSKQTAPSGSAVLFAANDGGTGLTAFGIWDSGSGERLRTLHLTNSSDLILRNQDWEAMAIGTCGNTARSPNDTCVYIADVGDNTASSSSGRRTRRNDCTNATGVQVCTEVPYVLYKVREPDWQQYQDNATIPSELVTALEFDYRHPSSPTEYANSEGIFLDHTGWADGEAPGDIYIVTKWGLSKTNTLNRLYHIPASAWPSEEERYGFYQPAVAGSYPVGPDGGFHFGGFTWTRADMSVDGTLIALGDVSNTVLYLRCPGQSVAGALAGLGARLCSGWSNPVGSGRQVETVAFRPDTEAILTIAEGNKPQLVWADLDFSVPTRLCPVVEFVTSNSGQQVCQTVPAPGSNRTAQVLADSWCLSVLDDGTAAPISDGPTPQPKSFRNTKAPTPNPTVRPPVPSPSAPLPSPVSGPTAPPAATPSDPSLSPQPPSLPAVEEPTSMATGPSSRLLLLLFLQLHVAVLF